ncbi:MAG: RHS repeat-associated core domain-containing protein, partial [Candidatus Methylomirabilota bacterium]
EYTYDAAGNRLTRAETLDGTTRTATYTYDPLNRLVQVLTTNPSSTESYTYDVVGNRLTQTTDGTTWTYTYNENGLDPASHALTSIRMNGDLQTTLAYDASGNLASRTDGTTTTSYSYNPDNRLASVTTPSTSESYAYDPEGRRIRVSRGISTTEFLYQGSAIYAEYGTSWETPSARYAHGPGVDQPLLRLTPGTSGWQSVGYHPDGLGSLAALTDGTGSLTAWSRYDAWGNVLSSSGTIPQYGYTGREPDGTGLLYYRARYYDPTLGRFTQRDPIGFRGGLNPYAYAENNPVARKDPTGLWGEEEHTTKYYGLDKGFWTRPENIITGTWRHFRDLNDVQPEIDAAIRTGNRAVFDALMHQGQDSFNPAHSNVIRHVVELIARTFFDGPDPDSGTTYPKEHEKMQEWTKRMEAQWDQSNPKEQPPGGTDGPSNQTLPAMTNPELPALTMAGGDADQPPK